MDAPKSVYWRIESIVSDGIIDTSGALQVGFVNIGQTAAKLNVNVPLPIQGVGPITAAYVQNILWFNITEGERDATAYRIIFSKPYNLPQILVFVKMASRDEKKK